MREPVTVRDAAADAHLPATHVPDRHHRRAHVPGALLNPVTDARDAARVAHGPALAGGADLVAPIVTDTDRVWTLVPATVTASPNEVAAAAGPRRADKGDAVTLVALPRAFDTPVRWPRRRGSAGERREALPGPAGVAAARQGAGMSPAQPPMRGSAAMSAAMRGRGSKPACREARRALSIAPYRRSLSRDAPIVAAVQSLRDRAGRHRLPAHPGRTGDTHRGTSSTGAAAER